VVCEFCSSTLYREGEVLTAGKKSIVGEPRSNLAVGARGRVGGLELEILGRVRFDHGTGQWDEWYAVDTGGRDHWIVEDERSYALERPGGEVDLVLDADGAPVLGAIVRHMGKDFQVDELGSATCVGGEGVLPRHIEPGETYRFVDLTAVNDDAILAIELGEPGEPPQVYVGRAVPASEVLFPPRQAPMAGDPDAGPRVEAKSVQCGQCGSGFDLSAQGDPALTATCTSCGAILQLDEGAARVVGSNNQDVVFPFAVGDRAELLDGDYEVVGRMLYAESDGSRTREYLLWSASAGYLWLEEYDGHYKAVRPTQKGPALSTLRGAMERQKVDCGGHTYQLYEWGLSNLVYVDGALPWLANTGDGQEYFDLVDPPLCYSVEITAGKEMERFEGTWIDSREVYAAFGKESRWQSPFGVGSAQPNPVGPTSRLASKLFFAFGLLNLFMACGTMGGGDVLSSASLGPGDFAPGPDGGGGSWTSEPFRIPADANIMGLHVGTNLSNNWASVSAAILPVGSDEPIGVLTKDLEYYSGHDSEGSWSEGSRKGSRFAVAPPAGEYRIEVEVEASASVRLTVQVTARDRLTRWPLLVGIMMCLPGFLIFLRRMSFENRRWGVGEDD
jgi:hypothetical protein